MDVNEWLRKQLEEADPDLLREMVRSFAETLMSADADEVCGAPYGTVSPDRVNRRNGYRTRRWDTRVGTIDLRIPKLREGTYFPDWLLDARTRAERAFVQCVAEALCAGSVDSAGGGSGGDPGDRFFVQVAGVGDRQGPRRAGRRLQEPASRQGPLHVRVGRRSVPQSQGGWPSGQRRSLARGGR